MKREEMISLLVLDRLDNRDDPERYMHLQKVLENGFRGFRNLSDKELMSEIRALGLERRLQNERYEGLDDFDEDHVFDSSLSVGHAFALQSISEYAR
ncbi:MAG: hypothetical protein Q8S26_08915 [Azonexus sp.]|nr:hypothetical protein [Azonexus sp.]